MPPTWLTIVAWISLALAFATAGAILFDIYARGRRQRMAIMEAVWPVTALYFGPLAWLAYRRWGRPDSPPHGDRASVAVSVSHCGAGCTLGDIAGAWLVLAAGWTLLGLALPAEYLVDFTLAFALGILFQYLAIAPMRGLGLRDGLIAALKADALSLTAFEIGLFGWMAVMQLVLFTSPHLAPDHAAYWFLMQVGMVLGFATAYPVNVWLVRRGVKEGM
ncbi:MAG TPA: DUF4396 domain-containing protein [Solirubrobacteraceae bacterium]|nr:DUF4396 domain-containing protein [Solirubrobacteraceae bacterium]